MALADYQEQFTSIQASIATIGDSLSKLQAEVAASLNPADSQTALTMLTDVANKLADLAKIASTPSTPVA
jgi:hypothetical protein